MVIAVLANSGNEAFDVAEIEESIPEKLTAIREFTDITIQLMEEHNIDPSEATQRYTEIKQQMDEIDTRRAKVDAFLARHKVLTWSGLKHIKWLLLIFAAVIIVAPWFFAPFPQYGLAFLGVVVAIQLGMRAMVKYKRVAVRVLWPALLVLLVSSVVAGGAGGSLSDNWVSQYKFSSSASAQINNGRYMEVGQDDDRIFLLSCGVHRHLYIVELAQIIAQGSLSGPAYPSSLDQVFTGRPVDLGVSKC